MKPHKILVFSDMHGERGVIKAAQTILAKDDYDYVINLGDFSHKVNDANSNLEDARFMYDQLSPLAGLRALMGNCDSNELVSYLKERKILLHDDLVFIGKTALIGRGGSHPTPFNTPMEFHEAQIKKAVEELFKKAIASEAERVILLTHEPPARTNADKLSFGHVGSEALRELIEAYKPVLNVCGHIHEAKSEDLIGKTLVINVGPASKGHFLEVTIGDYIKTNEVTARI